MVSFLLQLSGTHYGPVVISCSVAKQCFWRGFRYETRIRNGLRKHSRRCPAISTGTISGIDSALAKAGQNLPAHSKTAGGEIRGSDFYDDTVQVREKPIEAS